MDVPKEMMVANNCLTQTNPNFDFKELKLTIRFKIYQHLCTFLSLSLNIPILSNTSERSFSPTRKIKNWLRTYVTQIPRFYFLILPYVVEKKKTFLVVLKHKAH